ncbi:Protein ABHD13 [Pseudocercospora fuligena]|uniref:Protein ABHD13 n=1 Tax=Pseudocercospora fuligena TaxID=685502 RepID=A0A8H6RKV3_9PEZI|nr:Protein ABHD13 [Pseudocercospora fuligena]
MTVLFQDKIIYMPYMPPFARSEKMEDYTAICKPVEWQSLHIKSLDGTKIALAIGRLPEHISPDNTIRARTRRVVIAYFHGNGSSIPPRLPLMSGTLKAIERASADSDIGFVIVALSYRGYWTSSGRASQAGIEKDAQAMLQWIQTTYGSPDVDLDIMLWGQSLGAGVASTVAATYVNDQAKDKPPLTALILETPFTGIKSMLLALYPQSWLPYKYLWPLLWNYWDSEVALRRIAESGPRPEILLLPATRDEVVPRSEVDKLESICNELRLPMKRKDIIGALHFEATIRTDGQEAVARFVADTIRSRRS